MTGTAVSWGLGAALAIVASVAVWRLTRPATRRPVPHQRTDSALHLLMAFGMAAMLLPHGEPIATALAIGFGAAAVALAARGRLHHAAMGAIMALMVHGERVPASPAAMQMAMPSAGPGASPLLIAAFCYAAASACVFAWRMPAFAADGKPGSPRQCAADPLGRGCEMMMLISTAVMLLPMI